MISIAPPSGGPWGGTTVDHSFQELLENVFGTDVMQRFANANKDSKLDLERRVELFKRNINKDLEKGFITGTQKSLQKRR